MDRRLKLIWDFKGPQSAKTAAHHLIHLDEYVVREKIECLASGTEKINEHHHIAYIAIDEKNMPPVRDILKPHRGQLWLK